MHRWENVQKQPSFFKQRPGVFSRKSNDAAVKLILGTASEGAPEESSSSDHRLVPCLYSRWDRQLGPSYWPFLYSQFHQQVRPVWLSSQWPLKVSPRHNWHVFKVTVIRAENKLVFPTTNLQSQAFGSMGFNESCSLDWALSWMFARWVTSVIATSALVFLLVSSSNSKAANDLLDLQPAFQQPLSIPATNTWGGEYAAGQCLILYIWCIRTHSFTCSELQCQGPEVHGDSSR